VQPPIAVNLTLDVSPDSRVFLFTLGVSLLTGVIFGSAPAWRSSRPDIVATLKDDGTAARAGGFFTLRNALVVAQVAVSLVLLVAAGLLLRSLANARSIELGFNDENIAYVTTSLSAADYSEEEGRIFLLQAVERAAAMPGVVTASYATRLPLSLTSFSESIEIEGYEPEEGDSVEAEFNNVGPGYFEVLGVPLVRGREIAASDTAEAPPVAVVNETFAQRYWPDQDPIGKRLRGDSSNDEWIEVVGLCADYKMGTVGEEATPLVHTSLLQNPAFFESVMVRTSGDPAPVVARLREDITLADPDVAFFSSGTMEENLATVLFPVRMAAALLATFGAIALGLAAVGVYGVIAYTVSRRTREIGVRMALGASRRDVLRLVMGSNMVVVLVGVAIGALAAVAVATGLSSFLYDVSTIDPVTFIGTSAILIVVALLANYIPARRGTRVDPLVALRDH
jgi:predicted permease